MRELPTEYWRQTPTNQTSWGELVNREIELLDIAGEGRFTTTTATAERAVRKESVADEPKDRSLYHEFVTRPCRDLFGIALSGGGIRSATFNLGLLQGLHELGVLPVLDYLSTVSGGGYMGAFWSAWMARPKDKTRRGQFPEVPSTEQVESPEVKHLRRFSNFLAPRPGLLSYDTGRMIVAALSGSLVTLVASLSLMLIAIYAWLVLTQLLFAAVADHAVRSLPAIAFAVLIAVVLAAAELSWRRRGEVANWPLYVIVSVIGGGAAVAAWTLMARGLAPPYGRIISVRWRTLPALQLPIIADNQRSVEWLALLGPAGALAVGVLVLVLIRLVTSRFGSRLTAKPRDGSVSRVKSRLLSVAAAWSVIALLWCAGAMLWHLVTGGPAVKLTGLSGVAVILSAAFGKLQQFTARQPNKGIGDSRLERLRRRAMPLVAYLALAAVACALVLLVCVAADGGWAPLQLGIALAVTVLVLTAFDPNSMGLHAFYRDRLARAYLGASNDPAVHTAEVREHDDVALTDMQQNKPLQLVCCTVNDLASSDPVATLRRGAVSRVLSPVGFSVGSAAVPWHQDSQAAPNRWTGEAPWLATSITASGAAFNSQMGSKSMELGPGVTYLMATLNLRLGLWLRHPSGTGRLHGLLPGWTFYRELFGSSSATARRVNLSDGGHFENMGVFELLRRHCRYIIASDCGCDPDVSFDDFGNLVRRAREDLGVEIEIDLSPLRPRNGVALQPIVAGDIRYPTDDHGVLLLFKPTLVGNEPVDVQQYHARNEGFPHESTGDQFYDEAQWEAYRRLGLHAALTAFRPVVQALGADLESLRAPERAGELRKAGAGIFAYARRDWLPAPRGLTDRLSTLTSRAAQLDSTLLSQPGGGVPRGVYGEIGALLGREPSAATADELAGALGVVREALLFMEEAFACEELDRHGSHPMYLGLVNYFARWTHSPHLRAWWPVLRPLHTQRFARYLEINLGLGARAASAIYGAGRLSKDEFKPIVPGAIAARAWAEEGRAPAKWHDGSRIANYSFVVPLSADSTTTCAIQVAQAAVEVVDRFAMWDASEFYVAPSLWGAGIGEAFLDRLAGGAVGSGVTACLVQIGNPGSDGPATHKEAADQAQMYRAAGFREIWPLEGQRWTNGQDNIDLPACVSGQDGFRWLKRGH